MSFASPSSSSTSTSSMLFLCLFFFFVSLHKVVLGDLVISVPHELIDFSNDVNNGTSYSGTTVYLDSDLDFYSSFSQQFQPIGINSSYSFKGTFDGQGHVIKNLNISSSSESVGLFGYSDGASIKNVIFDSSCSIEGTANEAYVGSLVGHCSACLIESIVSMGSVIGYGLCSGGIIGAMARSASVKNTANYGSVTHYGANDTHAGGIVGQANSIEGYIQNCINNGEITIRNAHYNIYAGGVVGSCSSTAIRNCVNSGKINRGLSVAGGIAGSAFNSSIAHCYWNEETTRSASGELIESAISRSSSYNSRSFELAEDISIGKYAGGSLLGALNAFADRYYIYKDFSYWTLNAEGEEVSFRINDRTDAFATRSQLVLLPSLANDVRKHDFYGWYTDKDYSKPLSSFEIANATRLYSRWQEHDSVTEYTITFDTREGSPISPQTSHYLSVVKLPRNTSRGSCDFMFWGDEYGKMVSWEFVVPAHNVTLHATWLCTHIRTAEELIAFSKDVNSGNMYNGTTVVLESDIDFSGGLSENFEPIGNSWGSCFFGTFDGQGHTISNLAMSPFSQFVGLFGYTREATLKNIVVDPSCSIESFLESSGVGDVFGGGIVGVCKTQFWPCTIRNNVNMARISFALNTHVFDMSVGGIIGSAEPMLGMVTIRNCANYGDILCNSKESDAYVGGIAGYFNAYSSLAIYSIKNCVNYGSIVYDSALNEGVYVGGVIGYGMNGVFMNCVSFGGVSSPQADVTEGAVAGYARNSEVTWCYWDEAQYNESVGPVGSNSSLVLENTVHFDGEFCLEEAVSIGGRGYSTLLGAVNAFADSSAKENYYSGWVLNRNKNAVSFTIAGRAGPFVTTTSDLILLPNLADSGSKEFLGWYMDEGCTRKLNVTEIVEDMNLYGRIAEGSRKGHGKLFYRNIIISSGVVFVIVVSVVIVIVIRKRFGTKHIRDYYTKTKPLLEASSDEILY